MMVISILGVALLALLSGLGATKQDSHDTYMPGAIVTLAVKVEAPDEWALNPQVPLRIEVDAAALKKANFKVDKASWDFKVAGHDAAYTAEIPIKISPSLAGDKLEVPLKVNCGICTLDESKCTFVKDDVRVKLNVKSKAQPGDKNAPAKKGRLVAQHVLTSP